MARGDCHHIIPTSIGGPKNNPRNIYRGWTRQQHEGFHQYFRNFAPSVVIAIIKASTDEQGNLNSKIISSKDVEAWQGAFGNRKPEEVIGFMEERFLPIEREYLEGRLSEFDFPPRERRKRV